MLESVIYQICLSCDHFVDLDDDGLGNEFWSHLEDGEREHDHEATPSGVFTTLQGWRAARPDLFLNYPDDKIGPNSKYHLSARY